MKGAKVTPTLYTEMECSQKSGHVHGCRQSMRSPPLEAIKFAKEPVSSGRGHHYKGLLSTEAPPNAPEIFWEMISWWLCCKFQMPKRASHAVSSWAQPKRSAAAERLYPWFRSQRRTVLWPELLGPVWAQRRHWLAQGWPKFFEQRGPEASAKCDQSTAISSQGEHGPTSWRNSGWRTQRMQSGCCHEGWGAQRKSQPTKVTWTRRARRWVALGESTAKDHTMDDVTKAWNMRSRARRGAEAEVSKSRLEKKAKTKHVAGSHVAGDHRPLGGASWSQGKRTLGHGEAQEGNQVGGVGHHKLKCSFWRCWWISQGSQASESEGQEASIEHSFGRNKWHHQRTKCPTEQGHRRRKRVAPLKQSTWHRSHQTLRPPCGRRGLENGWRLVGCRLVARWSIHGQETGSGAENATKSIAAIWRFLRCKRSSSEGRNPWQPAFKESKADETSS